MPAATLTGVFTSVFISLTAFPLVRFITAEATLKGSFTFMAVGFFQLFALVVVIKLILPPRSKKQSESGVVKGRGLIYYTCCLFMWTCMADLALQAGHLELFGYKKNTAFFEHGESYLASPFGTTTQFWNIIVNYILYLIIIYQIDNDIDSRNAAIYWAGSILTSQFVVLVGMLSGSFSDSLQYSAWMNLIFVLVPLMVLLKYIRQPRSTLNQIKTNRACFWVIDTFLSLGLLAACIFSGIRGLAALDSNFPLMRNYVALYEPYILEPANFGKSWILYLAVYGIPFQLAAIYGLMIPGCQWLMDFSVFFAAGSLEGTVIYLSYSWYPSSQPAYRIPTESLDIVLLLNVALVVLMHAVMIRCMREPQRFLNKSVGSMHYPKKRVKFADTNEKSEHLKSD